MTNILADKVILITGGTRSIGRALVRAALQQNAYVAFCARNIEESAIDILQEASVLNKIEKVAAIAADIGDEQAVVALFKQIINKFGKVDIVINNAAITWDSLLVSLPKKGWDQLINVNLTGSFLITREALKIFMSNNIKGKIISIGSLAQSGAPSNAGYAASKGGLVGLMQAVARDYAQYDITANTISLGLVDTEMTRNYPAFAKRVLIESCPQKRSATPEEIANIVLAFAAKNLSCINGHSIFAAGGLTDFPLDFPG
jgi:3-oxoacyl-[acyl-carrier protein] reductase